MVAHHRLKPDLAERAHRPDRRVPIVLHQARIAVHDADDFDIAVLGQFADDGDHLGRTDIEPDDQVFVGPFRHSAISP